jgi:multiple antibiotic resistance protein
VETAVLSWPEYSRFAVSLFAILTPFAAVPAYLSLTRGFTAWERSRTAILAAGTAGAVLVIAALVGPAILGALGVSLGSLRIGGGLVLLLMALSMSNPRDASVQRLSANYPSGAIVPLGVPLLAGPGSISSVMVEMRHGAGIVHAGAVVSCVLATCVSVWAILRFAQPIGDRIGQTGLDILSRVFGLLLAAMAVKIIASGLRSLFPLLGQA